MLRKASPNLSLLRFARNDGEEPHSAHAFRRFFFLLNRFFIENGINESLIFYDILPGNIPVLTNLSSPELTLGRGIVQRAFRKFIFSTDIFLIECW